MKHIFLSGLLSLGMLAGLANAQEEGNKQDVTVSAFGVFQPGVSGNGVSQTANEQPGGLLTYRYFITPHQGLEFDYGLAQFNQQYTGAAGFGSLGLTGTNVSLLSDMHEATMSYVVRMSPRHRLSPFASIGTGAVVFAPVHAFVGTATPDTFVSPDLTYSAGADFAFSRKVSLRLGYRGDLLQAPRFGIGALNTGSLVNLREPFAGFSFHF
jgi:opacity protein-like surface antigen